MQCVELESLVVPLNPPPEFEAGRLDVGQIQALTMGGPNKARGPICKKTYVCTACPIMGRTIWQEDAGA